MKTLKNILHKLLYLVQLFLILIYIVLEELIWEQFAKPIFRYLKYLQLFAKLEHFLSRQNRYFILAFFLIIVVITELMGVATPIIALQGYIIAAILLYALKLLLAAFAFWMLNTQKGKLLSFKWFAYLYEKVITIKDAIENSPIYKAVVLRAKRVKIFIKLKIREFKNYLLNRFWR